MPFDTRNITLNAHTIARNSKSKWNNTAINNNCAKNSFRSRTQTAKPNTIVFFSSRRALLGLGLISLRSIFNRRKIHLKIFCARLFLEQSKKNPRKGPRKALRRLRKEAQGFVSQYCSAQGLRARLYAGRARSRKVFLINDCPAQGARTRLYAGGARWHKASGTS